MRSLLRVGSLLTLASAAAAQSPPDAFESTVKPALARSCYACHNAMLRSADLDLAAYESRDKVIGDPSVWERVVSKIKTRVMPPAGSPPSPTPTPRPSPTGSRPRWRGPTTKRRPTRVASPPGA